MSEKNKKSGPSKNIQELMSSIHEKVEGQYKKDTPASSEVATATVTDIKTSQELVVQAPAQLEFLPPADIVFNERNIENWVFFLFPHSRTKGLTGRRIYSNGKQQLVIKPTAGDKAYTTRTYKTWLALLRIWFNTPIPDGTVEANLSDVCRARKVSAASGKNRKAILEDLECLHDTVMDWVHAFDVKGRPTSLEKVRFVTDFKYEKSAHRDGKGFDRKFKLKINKAIIESIKARSVNPVPDAVFEIKSDISCLYFCLVDTKISLKNDGKPWEWGTLNSFEQLGLLETKKYRYVGDRKILATKIVKDIDGQKLTSGETLNVKLVKTKDGKDWKIRHWKTAPKYAPKLKPGLTIVNTESAEVQYLAEEIASVVGQADTHMQYYKKLSRHYSKDLIFRALGNYKEAKLLGNARIKDEGRFFSYTMHLVAHDMQVEWIGLDCGPECDLRKEHRLPLV